MKVLTLSELQFYSEAEKIINEVKLSYDQPDLVIGIATGGAILADSMKSLLDAKFIEIKSQRSSTQKKKNFRAKVILKWLPRFINNYLRIIEHYYRQWSARPELVKQSVIAEKIDISSIVRAKNILIVDDAVDSGLTMYSVIDYVKNLNAAAKIITATVTVTWRDPRVMPDVSLYKDTLIRFHWSEDA